MLKKWFCVVAMVVVAACQKDDSRVVVEAESPDGRSFYFMPIDEDGVTDITVSIAWPTVWAYDGAKNPAAPYIGAEAITQGGTDTIPPQEVLELFNDKNSYAKLAPNADYIYGEMSFPKEHTDQIVGIVSDMLTTPQFDDRWVERIKQKLAANQEAAATQPAIQGWTAVRRAVLGNIPLEHFLTLDDLDAIKAVSTDDLREWHQASFVQSGVTTVVTGAISREDAGKVVDRILAPLPKGQPVTAPEITADFAPKTILLHVPQAETTTLGFLGRLPDTTDGQDIQDLIALNLFARPGAGPLFDAVRTDLRASYGVNAGYANYDRKTRILFITGEVETEKLADARDVVRAAYDAFRTEPTMDGFTELRDSISSSTQDNVQYVNVVANAMLQLALDGQDVSIAPAVGTRIGDITADDIRTRLSSAFPPANQLITIAISPDAEALQKLCAGQKAPCDVMERE